MAISGSEKILLTVSLLNTAGIFIHIGISYYFAHSKMELMLSHLKNCPAVMLRTPSLKLGYSGKMYVFIAITAVLAMPRRLVRIGSASAEDIDNFPADLKRKIIMLYWSCLALTAVMCVLAVIVEFELV